MKILYIDPIFGISGDMMISAFLDAGLPFTDLAALFKTLPVDVPGVIPVKKKQGIIEGTHLDIDHSDVHLSVAQMEGIIENLDAEPQIRNDARGMLDILVAAEGKVHGVPREQVHFHELSHIDTLIDILSVAKGMHYFGIEKVYCGPVPLGSGTIKISHGIVPNPPPATVEILRGYNLLFLNETMELTTPTGATIVRYYVKAGVQAPAFAIAETGCGMGSYESLKPDALRIYIGESDDPSHDEEVWLIEVDLDDMEMEYVGAVAERIRQARALDVVYFPVHMKKGRIGIRLSVTASVSTVQPIIDTVLAETTTFGLRLRREQRRVLRREEMVVDTTVGAVRVKKGYDRQGNLVKTHIEFNDVKRIADEQNAPYRRVLDALKSEMEQALKTKRNLEP